MDLDNPLTKYRADQLYEPLHPVVRRDLLDNNTDYIVVGDTTVDRKVVLDYSYELPIGDKAITGQFIFNHDGTSVDLVNWYSYLDKVITKSVTFSAAIVGTEIRLVIVTSSVGEDPTIQYRKTTVGVVT